MEKSPQPQQPMTMDDADAYRLLVENVEDYAIFLTDIDGIMTTWNIGVQRILGYSQEEFIGQPTAITFTPEDREQGTDRRELQTAASQGRSVDERWHIRKDGSLFWASGIMTGLFDHDGTLRGFCKIMRDFTDRKSLEAERAALLKDEKKARTRAEEATVAKDEFLSIIAHELRTPLNVIQGWTSLLRSKVLDAEALEKACTTIERNVQIQSHLVNDLLDATRILQNGMQINVEQTEIVPILATTIEALKIDADEKSLRIMLSHQADIHTIEADPDRLCQVISNLLSNAIKFTPPAGTIEIRTSRAEDQLKISVCDTGIGITPEFLPHVFARYHREDSSSTRRFGGLGLGLFISRTLVELHGGTISVSSEGENQGATFTVTLPIRETAGL
jgi:PAS domain S-box-containing protein